jgi:hypothetical protein
VLGAFLLSHTVCGDCGLGFNGKSGKSNRTAIGVYLGMLAAVAVAMIVLR